MKSCTFKLNIDFNLYKKASLKNMPDAKPEHHDVFSFSYESEPNLKIGDNILVNILFDEDNSHSVEAEILDIVPPLLQPCNEDRFAIHDKILCKYFSQSTRDLIYKKYIAGEGVNPNWSIYYRVL